MGAYVFKRVVTTFITLALISFFTFMSTALLPGNPAELLLGQFATPEKVATITRQWGLDKPILYRYVVWINNLLHGNLGRSILSRKPVIELLLIAWPIDVELCLFSLTLVCLIGIPTGIIAAVVRPMAQRLLIATILVAQSIPSYVSALILILVVCLRLGWLPTSGYVPFTQNPVKNLQVMLLPAISLSLVYSGFLARFTRACVLDVLHTDFVRTARSKGLSEPKVILKHGFRSALIPVISLLGTQIVWLLGGSIIQEMIFVLPGLGQLVMRSVMNRDYAVIQAVVLLMGVIAASANLVVDLAYGVLDPRIRYE